MKFNIVPLTDYLKGHDLKIVEGKPVLRRHNGQIEIGCAFCKKSGLDFDGISLCCICKGEKKNLVKEPAVMCAFCRGTGASSNAVPCRVCEGKGLVHAEEPIEKCPECKGRGKLTGTDMMCIKCKGKGVVKGEGLISGGDYGKRD